MLTSDLHAVTIWDDLSLLLKPEIVTVDELGESVVSGNKDLLSSWELGLGQSESFFCLWDVLGLNSHGKKNLSDSDSCGLAKSFTEGTSHTLLESISSSAGKHFVDTDDVPWVNSDSHVEVVLSNVLDHISVA